MVTSRSRLLLRIVINGVMPFETKANQFVRRYKYKVHNCHAAMFSPFSSQTRTPCVALNTTQKARCATHGRPCGNALRRPRR